MGVRVGRVAERGDGRSWERLLKEGKGTTFVGSVDA